MSEVKRYLSTRALPDSGNWNSSCVPHTYVRASDYDALQSRLDAAEALAEAESAGADKAAEAMLYWKREADTAQQRSGWLEDMAKSNLQQYEQQLGIAHNLRQQLAERDALLRDCLNCNTVFAMRQRIENLLSSAEPVKCGGKHGGLVCPGCEPAKGGDGEAVQ
ncbi:hypothetical protein NDO41_07960 [Ectopseudomonas mendocina]|nr:hypothetical protein NDO41_07960 [Pseudomonas mendocina]